MFRLIFLATLALISAGVARFAYGEAAAATEPPTAQSRTALMMRTSLERRAMARVSHSCRSRKLRKRRTRRA